jgi:type II secretory pathway component PulF
MPVFTYTASDLADQLSTGTLTADTPAQGRETLRERGLRILAFQPAVMRSARVGFRIPLRPRRQDRIAEIARYLSMLLRAGVPLAETLEVVARQGDRRMAALLKEVRERVVGGSSFADALGEHREWFDAMFVSAVRMGELSGHLEEALCDLAEHLRAQQTLRTQLTTALTYPLILVCVGIGVVLFLMSYVVPQLLTVLAAGGRPLPASTMLLKRFSDLLVGYWPMLLILGVVLKSIVGVVLRDPRVRRAGERLQLRLPLLGALRQKSLVAQFAQQMNLLLRTGVPFVEAVRCVQAQTKHLLLAEELTAMARAVESGSDIAPTMSSSRIFPPVVAHLVAVGQNSGELTAMLSELKTRYETEVRLAMGKFTAALEPLLIVLLAAGVGFVVFACLMPILEATRGIAG